MKKTLVTGSTGKVGSVVVESVAKAGIPVLAATRSPQNVFIREGVDVVRFDYGDPKTYRAALAEVDRVFLMEPQPAAGPADAIMIPFVLAAIEQGCKLVMLSSASAAFQVEPLGRVEEAVRGAKEHAILRANWFMDNFHTWWAEGMKYGHVLPLPAGNARTPFVDARDVGSAAASALQRDDVHGRIWMLTGRESWTHAEVAGVVSQVTGSDIRYEDLPEDAFAEALTQAGLAQDYVAYILSLFRLTRSGVFDKPTEDVECLTGRKPRTLQEYAADYREVWQ